MLTASYYWVGAEAAIQGIRPTYYYKFNTRISMKDRIQDVRNWLHFPENKRPHLITFYISDVDHRGTYVWGGFERNRRGSSFCRQRNRLNWSER